MVKAKKTNKKKNSSKVSKYKLTGFASLFKNINFRSHKVRLATVLLVFGIVGGGVMTYRSFAATGTLGFSPTDFVDFTGAQSLVQENQAGAKRGSKVYKGTVKNSTGTAAKALVAPDARLDTQTSRLRLVNYLLNNKGKTARICVMARSNKNSNWEFYHQSIVAGGSGSLGYSSTNFSMTSGYSNHCTNWFRIGTSDNLKNAYIMVRGKSTEKGHFLRVASMGIETR